MSYFSKGSKYAMAIQITSRFSKDKTNGFDKHLDLPTFGWIITVVRVTAEWLGCRILESR